ncbi:bloom syndrome protein [Nematocida sp. AWRm77]|nr:bloom syndrome protein [Nematocida sp. AWRm77]
MDDPMLKYTLDALAASGSSKEAVSYETNKDIKSIKGKPDCPKPKSALEALPVICLEDPRDAVEHGKKEKEEKEDGDKGDGVSEEDSNEIVYMGHSTTGLGSTILPDSTNRSISGYNLTTEDPISVSISCDHSKENSFQKRNDLSKYATCLEQSEIDRISGEVCDLLEEEKLPESVRGLLRKRSSIIQRILKRKSMDTDGLSFFKEFERSADIPKKDLTREKREESVSFHPQRTEHTGVQNPSMGQYTHPVYNREVLSASEKEVQSDRYGGGSSAANRYGNGDDDKYAGGDRYDTGPIESTTSNTNYNLNDSTTLSDNTMATNLEHLDLGKPVSLSKRFTESVFNAQNLIEEVSSSLPCSENVFTENQWRAYVCLKKVFCLSSFRCNQLEIITQALEGKDLFVLMPTGGGKSLTFQLPAIMSEGITVVISPLLALIQDQIKNLIKRGIPAVAITSALTKTEKALAMQLLTCTGETIHSNKYKNMSVPLIKIVYVTPELLVISSSFNHILRTLLEKQRLSRFIIDEAHCVSQWGHDFRPDYTQMSLLKRDYPSVPITALTATATPAVQKDILSALQLSKCTVFSQSFNRPNIKYTVRPKVANPLPDIVSFVQTYYPEDSGIIYCLSKKDCEWLSEQLNRTYRMRTGYYHAGLSKKERTEIAHKWDTSQIQIVVATIAFGMGIDKKDVRFVVHYSLPKSLEGYYQETGRAGRDQLESECVLFYSYIDKKKLEFMIDRGETSMEAKNRQKDLLRRVISFCENKAECRRALILQYFGEDFGGECNQGCDNCKNRKDIKQIDCLKEALIIKDLVSRVSQITESILVKKCKFQSTQSKDIITRVVRWMVGQGYLKTKLVIGDRGFSWSYLVQGQGTPKSALISIHPDEIAPLPVKRAKVSKGRKSMEEIVMENMSDEFLSPF